MNNKPLFSIITVCLNSSQTIEKTIQSVLNQTCSNYEYIVIDGVSNDGTLEIVRKLLNDNKVINSIVSEKDNGIYDAMNKGIKIANGDWILFLNSGDFLFDKYVLEKVSKTINNSVSYIYGDTIMYNESSEKIIKASDIKGIKKKMPFCHQSVFNRASCIKKHGYDLNYRVCADYNYYVGEYLDGKTFMRVPFVVSKYLAGGMSKRNLKLYMGERCAIRKKAHFTNTIFLPLLFLKVRYFFSSVIKSIVKRV